MMQLTHESYKSKLHVRLETNKKMTYNNIVSRKAIRNVDTFKEKARRFFSVVVFIRQMQFLEKSRIDGKKVHLKAHKSVRFC